MKASEHLKKKILQSKLTHGLQNQFLTSKKEKLETEHAYAEAAEEMKHTQIYKSIDRKMSSVSRSLNKLKFLQKSLDTIRKKELTTVKDIKKPMNYA